MIKDCTNSPQNLSVYSPNFAVTLLSSIKCHIFGVGGHLDKNNDRDGSFSFDIEKHDNTTISMVGLVHEPLGFRQKCDTIPSVFL